MPSLSQHHLQQTRVSPPFIKSCCSSARILLVCFSARRSHLAAVPSGQRRPTKLGAVGNLSFVPAQTAHANIQPFKSRGGISQAAQATIADASVLPSVQVALPHLHWLDLTKISWTEQPEGTLPLMTVLPAVTATPACSYLTSLTTWLYRMGRPCASAFTSLKLQPASTDY